MPNDVLVWSRCPYFYFRANRPPLPPICPRKHTMHQRFARSTGTQTHPSYACIYTCTCRSVQAVCPRMGAKYPAHPPTIQHSCKCIRCPDQTTVLNMQHTNGNECVSLGICLQARVCMYVIVCIVYTRVPGDSSASFIRG